jgi:Flp pilus assembly protein TadG
VPRSSPCRRSAHAARGSRRGGAEQSARGQALVEFALVSIIFFTIVFGTIDLGRAVYMKSELTNSVREGARYARVKPTDTSGIKNAVITRSPGLGLTTSSVTVTCSGTCKTGGTVKVQATVPFTAFAQNLLGIDPITLNASATVDID